MFKKQNVLPRAQGALNVLYGTCRVASRASPGASTAQHPCPLQLCGVCVCVCVCVCVYMSEGAAGIRRKHALGRGGPSTPQAFGQRLTCADAHWSAHDACAPPRTRLARRWCGRSFEVTQVRLPRRWPRWSSWCRPTPMPSTIWPSRTCTSRMGWCRYLPCLPCRYLPCLPPRAPGTDTHS